MVGGHVQEVVKQQFQKEKRCHDLLAGAEHHLATTSLAVRHDFSSTNPTFPKEDTIMLRWALIFAIISLVAALLGFTGIAGAAAGIAKFLFFLFVVLFLIFLIMGATIVKKVT